MKPRDYIADGLSQIEIAEILGVTREYVSQIERKAIKKLRDVAKTEGISFSRLFETDDDDDTYSPW